MMSAVSRVAAAPSDRAVSHFAASFEFEIDCSDVHHALGDALSFNLSRAVYAKHDFILLDVRSPDMFTAGRIVGAFNLPHGNIIESVLTQFPKHRLVVCCCAGPHCNGATRGAIRCAQLGRPVKIMIGGVAGWLGEGFKQVS